MARISVGTKSVLWGAHAFWLHPWFLMLAWKHLYGFPWDLRLWVCFAVHDLGYWGRANVEGAGCESHVDMGARIMRTLFGEPCGDFVAAHSRYWARKSGKQVSKYGHLDDIYRPQGEVLPPTKREDFVSGSRYWRANAGTILKSDVKRVVASEDGNSAQCGVETTYEKKGTQYESVTIKKLSGRYYITAMQ